MTSHLVFICYSHEDEREKKKLLSHLEGLRREFGFNAEAWHDDNIAGGEDWEQGIYEAIDKASVAILLVTDAFLASQFIIDKEIPKLLERHKNEGLPLIPVIARYCVWEKLSWLTKMQVRPNHGIPVWSDDTSKVDRDLTAIVSEVTDILSRLSKKVLDESVHAAQATMELLYRRLNDLDFQQGVANVIASLKVSSLVPKTSGLVRIRHSFPRHTVDSSDQLIRRGEDYLREAIRTYQHVAERSEVEVWNDINEQVRTFLDAKGAISEMNNMPAPERRPDSDYVIRKVIKDYPFVNGFQPLHERELKEICDTEQIEVYFVKDLPVLSLFMEYNDRDGSVHRGIAIKDVVHPALKEFLLGHELGHWFLHFESGFMERHIGSNYHLGTSHSWLPFEADANTFAMHALLPNAYLADCEIIDGTLSAEKLIHDFTQHMGPMSERLKQSMLAHIIRRLHRYKNYKDSILPFLAQVDSIQEEIVDSLLEFIESNHRVNWARMDENFRIVDASPGFLELFGVSKEEAVGKLSPTDFAQPVARDRIQNFYIKRMNKLKAIFYFTEVRHSRQNTSRQVGIYSFPILRNDVYIGSVGLVIPFDQAYSFPRHS